MKTTTKQTKYEYLKIIQGCYDGRTWDDCCAYDARDPQSLKECRADYKLYRENEPPVPHRLVERRVPRSERALLK